MTRSKKGGITVARKMGLCKNILEILGGESWRWTQLENKFTRITEASSAEFYFIIRYMLRSGWIERPKRGVYVRTKKGEALLEAL